MPSRGVAKKAAATRVVELSEIRLPAGFAESMPEVAAEAKAQTKTLPNVSPEARAAKARRDTAASQKKQDARLTIDEYAELLRQDVSGVPIDFARADELEVRSAAGEDLAREERIMLDAAQRMTRPQNRTQFRRWRGRPISRRFAALRAQNVRRPRCSRPAVRPGRRHVAGSRTSRGSPAPSREPDRPRIVRRGGRRT